MQHERRDSAAAALLVGLLLGAAIGAVAGLLTAPVPGREARRMLSDARVRLTGDVGELLERAAELGDTLADWGTRLIGAEAGRTRHRIAELRADVERLAASRR